MFSNAEPPPQLVDKSAIINPSPQIISVSRRSDIPAFYSNWFLESIKKGYVDVAHPFSKEIHKISLKVEDSPAIVFWTRSAKPLLPHLEWLKSEGYTFYFLFTLTGLPLPFEKGIFPVAKMLQQMLWIAERFSSEALLWRYDPIFLHKELDSNWHIANFKSLIKQLSGSTHSCIISFLQVYKKVQRQFEKAGISYTELDLSEKISLVQALKEIAGEHGITLKACCSPELLKSGGSNSTGIEKSHCIKPEILTKLNPNLHFQLPQTPLRKGCGCFKSFDIGTYGTCRAGCLYCYAA